jgi:dihydroorotase
VALSDRAVEASGFDTHTKMHPPLRAPEDVEALKAGLADGTIDALCTDHAPHAAYEKDVEFTAAPFGITGLSTAWGLIGRELIEPGVLSVAEAVRALTTAPRRILRLDAPTLAEGAPASLTVFDASTRWTVTEDDLQSKSRNTPFRGEELVGRPWAIYTDGQLVHNEPGTA